MISLENLKNEIPLRLGKIRDVSSDQVPVLNDKSLKDLCLDVYEDLVGETGFLNSFFSQKNARYRGMIHKSESIDTHAKVWELASQSIIQKDSVPFTPIVAVSGGFDSGLVARLVIDAYKNRRIEERTDLDLITIVNFKTKYYNKDDTNRGREYIKYLVEQHSSNVPIKTLKLEYPISEIEKTIYEFLDGHDLFYGKIQNMPMTLTNVLISLPSEENGFLVGIDTTNLTEFLLDEVTNGANGGTNLAMIAGLPKSVIIAMSEMLGIDEYLSSENSTTWEEKTESYLDGATSQHTKRVFHAIDTILHLAINEGKTVKEIQNLTQYNIRLVTNVFARLLNHSKRFNEAGQSYKGDLSSLFPKKEEFFKNYYARKYVNRLSECFGV